VKPTKKQKRLLILAGSNFQIPVIEYAKSKGHYVFTCDNKPDNPGHKIADEYINISTTDLVGVLQFADQNKIDGILAYGSDPAAPTAAYVAEKLHLPGNSYNSVLTLSDKGLFRKFLEENKFSVPKYKVVRSLEDANEAANFLKGFIFVKPVDSSGSKGITRINAEDNVETAYNYALSYSRNGGIIIEEEIKGKGSHIHGEAFFYQGELKFLLMGDQYFSKVNLCAPLSTTLPSLEHSDFMQKISDELVKLISLVGYKTGGLNIEILRDSDDKIFFVEIGARNGGNMMPELAELSSGFNLAAANVNAAMNNVIDFHFQIPDNCFCTQIILHSHANGKFNGINLPESYKKYLKVEKLYYNQGDDLQTYRGSQDVVGLLLFSFTDKEICKELIWFITNINVINLL